MDVLNDIYFGEVIPAIELLMNKSHRCDPILSFYKNRLRTSVCQFIRLKVQQAYHYLQVVLYPMVDLTHEYILLL